YAQLATGLQQRLLRSAVLGWPISKSGKAGRRTGAEPGVNGTHSGRRSEPAEHRPQLPGAVRESLWARAHHLRNGRESHRVIRAHGDQRQLTVRSLEIRQG